MPLVHEEVLLGRIRRESELRAEALAALRADLTDLKERVTTLKAQSAKAGAGSSSAVISTIERVLAAPGFALAERIDRLEAEVKEAGASSSAWIQETRRTLATSTFALAEIRLDMGARFNESLARIEEVRSAYAAADTAIATRTGTLEAQVQTPGSGLLARVTTVETAKVDAAGAAAEATNVVSASLTSTASGTIGAAVTTAASAYVSPLGEVKARWGVNLDINGRVVGKIKLDGSGATSNLDMQASVIRLFNGTTDVEPFRLSGGTLYLQNVVAETIAANISITTPTIVGGTFKINGASTICGTSADGSDNGIIRMNGGGGDGQTRGGQIDVLGNEYTTVSGFGGSVLITPGDHADGSVRIRSRDGVERITVRPDGDTWFNGTPRFQSGLVCQGSLLGVSSSVLIDGDFETSGGRVRASSGSLASPGFAFTGDTDTGIRHVSSGYMDFVCDGVARMALKTTEMHLAVPLRLDNGFVAGTPTATGTLTVRDSSGTTYKLLATT
jgi:hypothetical protein